MKASKDHPSLDDVTVVWNCFGVGGEGEGEGVSGGRELTEGVKRVHAVIQVRLRQCTCKPHSLPLCSLVSPPCR